MPRKTIAKPTHVRAAGKGRKYSRAESLAAKFKGGHGKDKDFIKSLSKFAQAASTQGRKLSPHARAGGLTTPGGVYTRSAPYKRETAKLDSSRKRDKALLAKKKSTAQAKARTKQDALIRSSYGRKK